MATPKRVVEAVKRRDRELCVWHGDHCDADTRVPQHRQGGMGGRKDKHRLSNVLWMCSRVNGLIESDADMAIEARMRGVKISLHADPERERVMYSDGSFWMLGDDGSRVPYGP